MIKNTEVYIQRPEFKKCSEQWVVFYRILGLFVIQQHPYTDL